MFLVVAEEIRCFQDNAVLEGDTQSKIFKLVLTPAPENDELCVAADGRVSTCSLEYLDSANKVQTIDSEFTYFQSVPNIIVFDLSSDVAKYTLIAAKSLLSYQVKLVGSLESPGAVQTIQHTQMNATNCWDDLVLRYNRSAGHEFLQMDGTPLDCQITAPVVKFEYFAEERWRSFGVQGVSGEAGYYDSTQAFDQKATKHFKQPLSTLTDPAEVATFKEFFVHFERNRTIQTRLHLVTKINKLDQVILAEPHLILSIASPCYSQLKPVGYISATQILAFSNNVMFSTHTECNQNTVSVHNQLRVITEAFNYSSAPEINTKDQFINKVGFILRLDVAIPGFEAIGSGSLISYMTYRDENDVILDEESVLLEAKLSCFQNIQAFFRRDELCVQIQTYDSEKCSTQGHSVANYILGVQPESYQSRQIAFSFVIDYVFNGKLQCTSTYQDHTFGVTMPGTVAERAVIYEKMVANHTNLYNFVQSENEFPFPSVLLLSDFSNIYTHFAVIAGLVFVFTGIGLMAYLCMASRL
eukprot:EST44090.1 Hypothetical protein SS50377_16089 [Spironucleus salmonicida]